MEIVDYNNIKPIDSGCGLLKEGFEGDIGFARATLTRETSMAAYHGMTTEYYMVIDGSGELRIREIDGQLRNIELKSGIVVKILPGEVHQAKTEKSLTVEAITIPAWTQEDEIESKESLF